MVQIFGEQFSTICQDKNAHIFDPSILFPGIYPTLVLANRLMASLFIKPEIWETPSAMSTSVVYLCSGILCGH